MLSLIQISDLHITLSPEDRFRGVDTRASLNRVLQTREVHEAEALIVTGDLAAKDPHPEIYRYIKNVLDACGTSYHILPGNHDRSDLTAEIFGMELNAGKLNRFVDHPAPMIFMDSSTEETLPEDLAFLENALRHFSGRRPLLFIHHPLRECDHPYFDTHCVLNGREKICEVLERENGGGVRHVFSGHAHKSHSQTVSGIAYHVSPSTACEFYSTPDDVFDSHQMPGFRKIVVEPVLGGLDTRTIYLS